MLSLRAVESTVDSNELRDCSTFIEIDTGDIYYRRGII